MRAVTYLIGGVIVLGLTTWAEARPPARGYTLVISARQTMTRFDYPTLAACQRARDEAQRQADRLPPGAAAFNSGVVTMCVPRT